MLGYRAGLLLLVAFSLFPFLRLLSQERLLISQYMYNGLVINPAYAGSQQVFSLVGLYRQQWLNVEGAPAYQVVSAHVPMFRNRIGVGLLVTNEQVGIHRDFSAFTQYSYKLKLPHGYFSMGLSGGASFKSSDFSRLDLLNTNDPYLRGSGRRVVPNFGLGLYYYNARVYTGISIPYILNTYTIRLSDGATDAVVQSAFTSPRSVYVTGGFVVGEGRVFKSYPSTLIRIRQGSSIGVDLNYNAIFYDTLMGGVSYRVGNSVVLLTQIILNENFRVMYSYDFVTTGLYSDSRGSHELSLNYRIRIEALSQDPHCSAYF